MGVLDGDNEEEADDDDDDKAAANKFGDNPSLGVPADEYGERGFDVNDDWRWCE